MRNKDNLNSGFFLSFLASYSFFSAAPFFLLIFCALPWALHRLQSLQAVPARARSASFQGRVSSFVPQNVIFHIPPPVSSPVSPPVGVRTPPVPPAACRSPFCVSCPQPFLKEVSAEALRSPLAEVLACSGMVLAFAKPAGAVRGWHRVVHHLRPHRAPCSSCYPNPAD